jgi:hypothetical protein
MEDASVTMPEVRFFERNGIADKMPDELALTIVVMLTLLVTIAVGVGILSTNRKFRVDIPEVKSMRDEMEEIIEGDSLPAGRAMELLQEILTAERDTNGLLGDEQLRANIVKVIADLDGERLRLIRNTRRLEAEFASDDRRYALLRSYAQQGLNQTRVSFVASLTAAGLGFAVILTGVALATLEAGGVGAITSVAAGAIIDAVSLLFFAQDRRHQRTMFDFFERLREDRKLDEALLLLRNSENGILSARVHAALTLHFASVPNIMDIISTSRTPGQPEQS